MHFHAFKIKAHRRLSTPIFNLTSTPQKFLFRTHFLWLDMAAVSVTFTLIIIDARLVLVIFCVTNNASTIKRSNSILTLLILIASILTKHLSIVALIYVLARIFMWSNWLLNLYFKSKHIRVLHHKSLLLKFSALHSNVVQSWCSDWSKPLNDAIGAIYIVRKIINIHVLITIETFTCIRTVVIYTSCIKVTGMLFGGTFVDVNTIDTGWKLVAGFFTKPFFAYFIGYTNSTCQNSISRIFETHHTATLVCSYCVYTIGISVAL